MILNIVFSIHMKYFRSSAVLLVSIKTIIKSQPPEAPPEKAPTIGKEDKSTWRKINRGIVIPHDLDKDALTVSTNSKSGSGDIMQILFFSNQVKYILQMKRKFFNIGKFVTLFSYNFQYL